MDIESKKERDWQLQRRVLYRKLVEESLGEKRLVRYKWMYCLGENKDKRCLTYEVKNVSLNKMYVLKVYICHSREEVDHLLTVRWYSSWS